MGALSTVKDVLSIIRDLLLIGFIAGILFGIVNVSTTLGKLNPASFLDKNQPQGAPKNADTQNGAGGNSFIASDGGAYPGQKITDSDLNALYTEAKRDFAAGNNDQGLNALERLENAFSAKDLKNEVNTVRNLRNAIQAGDSEKLKQYGALLHGMFEG